MSWVTIVVVLLVASAGLVGAAALGRERRVPARKDWTCGGLAIRAEAVADGWRYRAAVPWALFEIHSVQPGTEATLVGQFATRDAVFDRRFQVGGEARSAVVLLDGPLRQGMLTLAELGEVTLRQGELSVLVESCEVPRGTTAAILATVAERLRPDGILARLRVAACSDPLPEIREAAHRALDYAGVGDAHWRQALHDASPEVRLFAAARLNTEGEPTLWALAEDPSLEVEIRRRAAELLLRSIGRQSLSGRVLNVVLPHPSLASTLAGRISPGRIPASALSLLARSLASATDAERISAVLVLARQRTPEIEAYLLPLLHDPSARVRLATASALGEVGGAAAVRTMRTMLADVNVDPELQMELGRSVARCDPRGVLRA